jgi:hypothetical protein
LKRFVLIFSLIVLIAGCGVTKPTANNDAWTIKVLSWETKTSIPDKIWGYYVPDDGYLWLAVELEVKNNKTEANSINWFSDNIDYVALNGYSYNTSLVFNSPVDGLEISYQPGQTKIGDVFFEIPTTDNSANGKLIINMSDGPENLTINLD